MKNIKYLSIIFIVMLAFSACNDDSNYVIESNTNEFGVFPVALPVSADGGVYELTITGHEAWTAELSNSNTTSQWCELSATSGDGGQVITLNVQPSNSFVKNRTIIINVSSATKSLKSKVIQETLTLGEDEVLINGLVWSTKNVGLPGTFVDYVDEVGYLYQFNRKEGWPYSPSDVPSGYPTEYTNDGTNWTDENNPCPDGWRIPTTQEMVDLWNIGATWAKKSQTGYKCDGLIVGVDPAVAPNCTKDNMKQMGALFLPVSGWRNGDGTLDRTWLVAVRSATSLSATHGGMSLGDSGGYRDVWGWGDGQKERAGMIRPVKKISVEE